MGMHMGIMSFYFHLLKITTLLDYKDTLITVSEFYRSYVRSSALSGVFGKLSGARAHAFIFEMVTWACRENGNNLNLIVN